jgi:hypothetical protein
VVAFHFGEEHITKYSQFFGYNLKCHTVTMFVIDDLQTFHAQFVEILKIFGHTEWFISYRCQTVNQMKILARPPCCCFTF